MKKLSKAMNLKVFDVLTGLEYILNSDKDIQEFDLNHYQVVEKNNAFVSIDISKSMLNNILNSIYVKKDTVNSDTYNIHTVANKVTSTLVVKRDSILLYKPVIKHNVNFPLEDLTEEEVENNESNIRGYSGVVYMDEAPILEEVKTKAATMLYLLTFFRTLTSSRPNITFHKDDIIFTVTEKVADKITKVVTGYNVNDAKKKLARRELVIWDYGIKSDDIDITITPKKNIIFRHKCEKFAAIEFLKDRKVKITVLRDIYEQ